MGNETEVGFRQLEFASVLSKIKKLQNERIYRDRRKLFFAEGIRNFVEAVDNNHQIDTLIYSEKLLISPIARKILRRLKRAGVPFARASSEQFRVISKTERASGIAGIFQQKVLSLDQIKPDEHICWTALSHIRSLGNLGTLIRTSAAIGAGGFILIGDEIDAFDPDVVRPTMGAIFRQKIIRTSTESFHKWSKINKIQIVGASPAGLANYTEIRYKSPTILMLGNERSGLTPDEKSVCQQLIRIPMCEGIDSLNVAVAGSLLMYEVFRSANQEKDGT